MTSSQFHHQDVSSQATMESDSHLSLNGQMVASLESSLKEEEDVPQAQINLKEQVNTLKRNLQIVESKLNEESTLRLKAERLLDEYKVREKSLLKIEQEDKALQEEVKWRNEQFQSLQEAHNRMRDQFHEGQRMWAAEKAVMLRNIEVLTENATELERLQAVVNDVRECNTKAESRILLLEDRLRDAQRELEAKNNLSHSFLTVQEHEEVVLAMRSDCEALQRQLSTCDAERFELEKERDKLLAESKEKRQPRKREKEDVLNNAEVEGRKERSSLPVGQRLNTRQQLEDFAKQVKSLNSELQKWKDMATESNEGSSKLQKENEELRAQLNEWMQKESEYNGSIKDLEADVQKWKHSATNHSDENRLHIEELENLRAEVEKWKNVAAAAEGEGKLARRKPLGSLRMLEDETEVISSNPSAECDSERSLREEEMDCSWQGSGRTSNEWKHAASEPETALQAEVEDWKKRIVRAEKEQEDMRQQYETTVKELHLEVETWKKSAACAAEERLERAELEKKFKEFQVMSRDAADHVAEERQRSALELAELQAELQSWKARAADAAEECTSLRDAHEEVIKELQLCKENAEAAAEKGKSVRANLEKEVQALENQVHVWKHKAEEALEGVAKNIEYEDLIKVLNQERASVQLQLERALLEMEEKETAVASDSQALQDELGSAIAEKSAENHQLCNVITGLKSELSELKGKADGNHSSQLLQLQSLLTETQSQLQEWQEKATAAFQAEEELRHAIEEIRSQTEELHNLSRSLKDELLEWKEKAKHLESIQRQLTSSLAASQEELQLCKQKAMDAANASELQVRNSVSDLETELCQWKEKAQGAELLQQQMKTSLTETERELQDIKEKMAAFASSTDSLKDELSGANELASALTTQLSNQKQEVLSLQKLNRQLEAELLLVREEALSRKEWMTQILTQLEGTVSMTQKGLQSKLYVAQHRLLGNEIFNSRIGDEAAAKAFPVGSDSAYNFVNCISSPETAALFTSHPQSSKSESSDLRPDIFRGSVMNPDFEKLRQDLSSLNSFVSKLEHARTIDGENSLASDVVSGEEKMRVVLLQKQVESSREFVQLQKNRINSLSISQGQSGARSKVLAEVDANSLRVLANHE